MAKTHSKIIWQTCYSRQNKSGHFEDPSVFSSSESMDVPLQGQERTARLKGQELQNFIENLLSDALYQVCAEQN